MNDFEGLLATDYGFKPQGKSAPMAASSKGSSNPSTANSVNFDLGSYGNSRSTKHSSSFGGSFPNDRDSIFEPTDSQKNQNLDDLDDFIGGSGKFGNKLGSRQGDTDFNFDSMFLGSSNKRAQSMNSPIYDQPVYDDDIFDGVPGLKTSSKVKYDNVFVSSSSPSKRNAAFDDFLGVFGNAESTSNTKSSRKVEKDEKGIPAFDNLLPGFGGSSSPGNRTISEAKWSSEPSPAKTSFKPVEDPFMGPWSFRNPLDEISELGSSAKINSTSAASNRIFEDVDPFAGLGKSVPAFSSEANKAKKNSSPSRVDMNPIESQGSTNKATIEKTSISSPERFKPKNSVEYDSQTDQFDIPTSSSNSQKFVSRSSSPSFDATIGSKDTNFQGNIPPMFENNLDFSDDVWLTVSEIPLFTQPTSAPPPSRPPPPIPGQVPKSGMVPSPSTYSKKKTNDYSFPNSTGNFQTSKSTLTSVRASNVSPQDDFEEFSMGDGQSNVDELANGLSNEEFEMNSAAAAMKEAMDRAEAKFKHAKEVRERGGTKPARSKETGQLDKAEKLVQEERARRQEKIDRDRLQREKEEEESEKQRMERERDRAREIEKEREEKEREQRRLEKEREREIEREKARQLVERATREARERAAVDARLRAERAAVGKANAEARERSERAAVQRAQAEARERAATEARERAEKAAAEARERTNMEAKEREVQERAGSARTEAEARARAERAAVERAAAEARERAATSAAAAAAAAASASARTNQQQNEHDLESFFGVGTRASSAPRHRTAPSENFFDPPQPQSRYSTETAKTASVSTSSMRKASSTTNIVDDLSSIFGAAPSSGDFQDVEGESEERRRARLERHQRTQERAAKALAEKNQRDLQNQREQAERHRIAETLDVEIKRWAAGKEGNLRALLSTLQYVLWPECGWQPVSLTDLITGAAVKKVYRKATLCIHPDKVQQKGANLQQKYVAEKVFDILKEAWNKFNSEELF